MATTDEHIRALLSLPAKERAHAAKLLIDSLDEDFEDTSAESMRAAELTRRARSVVDGTAAVVDIDEVRRRVAARLREVRGQ